jgi:D-serine dehydratase
MLFFLCVLMGLQGGLNDVLADRALVEAVKADALAVGGDNTVVSNALSFF